MRFIFLLALIVPSAALAQVRFSWRADGNAEALVESGEFYFVVRGYVREGQIRELTSGSHTVWIIPFSNSFVAVAWANKAKETGTAVILERQNAQYSPISAEIHSRASTVANDLKNSVETLMKANGWDQSLAVRALVAYFDAHPDDSLINFAAAVEQGQVKTLAKPRFSVDSPSQTFSQERNYDNGFLGGIFGGMFGRPQRQEEEDLRPPSDVPEQPVAPVKRKYYEPRGRDFRPD